MNQGKRPVERFIQPAALPLPNRPGIHSALHLGGLNTVRAQQDRVTSLSAEVAASRHLGAKAAPVARGFKRTPGA